MPPLSMEDALRAAMQAPPPEDENTEEEDKDAESDRDPSSATKESE